MMPGWKPWAISAFGSTIAVSISSAVLPRQDLVEVRADGAVRLGGGEGVARAAAVVGEDLAAGPAGRGRRLDPGHAGDRADVGGDVLGVGAGDEVGAACRWGLSGSVSRGCAIWSLTTPSIVSWSMPGVAGVGEGGVEVGTDVAVRARLLEVVAGAALGDEERPAVGDVGVLAASRSR